MRALSVLATLPSLLVSLSLFMAGVSFYYPIKLRNSIEPTREAPLLLMCERKFTLYRSDHFKRVALGHSGKIRVAHPKKTPVTVWPGFSFFEAWR